MSALCSSKRTEWVSQDLGVVERRYDKDAVYINLPEHHRHYSKDESVPTAATEADEEEGVKLMRGSVPHARVTPVCRCGGRERIGQEAGSGRFFLGQCYSSAALCAGCMRRRRGSTN